MWNIYGKSVERTFLGAVFWVPIPFKWYIPKDTWMQQCHSKLQKKAYRVRRVITCRVLFLCEVHTKMIFDGETLPGVLLEERLLNILK